MILLGTRKRWLLLALSLITFVGCGQDSNTFPVAGRVELPGNDVGILSGHVLEAVSLTDPEVRAYGSIKPDGSFELESLTAGKISPGAQAGSYQMRVVLGDDDAELRRQALEKLHPNNFDFATSGIALLVPSTGVVLKLQGKK